MEKVDIWRFDFLAGKNWKDTTMAFFQIFQILELPSETDRLETHQVVNFGFQLIFKIDNWSTFSIDFTLRHF